MYLGPTVPDDDPVIYQLLDAAFGERRRTSPAYALRAGSEPCPGLSFCVRNSESEIRASISFWPLALCDDETGEVHPMTLLGPLAVHPDARGTGLGSQLVEVGLARAGKLGHDRMMLIGDAPFYGRFGFTSALTGGWALPGPVDRDRLLAMSLSGREDWPERARVLPAHAALTRT